MVDVTRKAIGDQFSLESVFTVCHLYHFRFRTLLDRNASPYMLFRMAARWAGVRLEGLIILMSLGVNLACVLIDGITPSDAGLAITYTIQVGLLSYIPQCETITGNYDRYTSPN